MERREILAKSAAGLAAVLAPKRVLPFTAAASETSRESRFRSLWREAHLAHYFDEQHRAFGLFQQAFDVAGGLDSETPTPRKGCSALRRRWHATRSTWPASARRWKTTRTAWKHGWIWRTGYGRWAVTPRRTRRTGRS
jgi:hypothetical protein